MSHQVNALTFDPSNMLLKTGKDHLHWCLSQLPANDMQRLISQKTYFIELVDRASTCPGRDVDPDSFVVFLDTAFFTILSREDATTFRLLLAALGRELAPIVAEDPESDRDVLKRWGLETHAGSPRIAPSADLVHQRRLKDVLQGPLEPLISRLRPRIIAARGVTWTLRGSEVSPPADRLILVDQLLLMLLDGSQLRAEMVRGVLAHELAHIEYERVVGRPSPENLAGEIEIDAIAARWGFGPGLRAFHRHSLDTMGTRLSVTQRQDAERRIAALR